ncbi:hypothetical protein [Sphingobacterium hungaricum]
MLRIKPKILLLIIGCFFSILAFTCSFSKLFFAIGREETVDVPYFVIFGSFAVLYLFYALIFPKKMSVDDAFNTIRFLIISCLLIALSFLLYNAILYSNPQKVIHHYDIIWIIFFAVLWIINALVLSFYYKLAKKHALIATD